MKDIWLSIQRSHLLASAMIQAKSDLAINVLNIKAICFCPHHTIEIGGNITWTMTKVLSIKRFRAITSPLVQVIRPVFRGILKQLQKIRGN